MTLASPLPNASVQVKRLANIASINPRLDAVLNAESTVSFVPMAALSAVSASVEAEEMRTYGAVAKGYTAFRNGDVLVAKITPCFENNKIGQANLTRPVGFGSTEFHVVRPHADIADPRYILNFLRQDHVRAEGQRKMTGSAGQRRVPEHFLAKLDIPLPPLPEQRRIAAILDQADALRAKRRAALAQLDEMAQAIFVEMFVPGSAAWPTETIGALGNAIRTGPFGSQLLHSEFVDDGVAVLGIDNAVRNEFTWGERRYITSDKYRELSRFRVFPDDVIITIMGTCGRVAIVPADIELAITTKHLCSITLEQSRCLPVFLHACLLMHPAVLHQMGISAKGAIMPGLNMGIIKSIKLALPPLKLQAEFVKRSLGLQDVREGMIQSLKQLDGLFSSLQHRAFNGYL